MHIISKEGKESRRNKLKMENLFLGIILHIAKFGMEIIYFFIKLFTKQKNKVTMLSRQSDSINLDFRLLRDELKNCEEGENIEVKIFCKKIPKNIWGRIKYCFFVIKNMYHIAESKVCVVDGYNIPISALKHKKGLEIIQIWHAMGAIKKFGFQVIGRKEGSTTKIACIMKMHANYTCVTCTSEITRKFYSEAFRTDINKIKVLGMPRLDYVLGKNNEIDKKVEELLKQYPELKRKPIILYVPTFRKKETIDIDKVINAVDEEKYNLIIRLHPLDETKVDKKYIIDKEYSTYDLLKVADFIVTDYSAIAFETAALNKPLYFYLYDIRKYSRKRGVNIDLETEMKDCTRTSFDEIMKIINSGEYNYEELRKFREKYVETFDTDNTKRIADYIREKI